MKVEVTSNYYTSRKSWLVRGFDWAARKARNAGVHRYGEEFTDAIIVAARQEYESLIPDLPYIGGGRNPRTLFIIAAAMFLALYRPLKARSRPVEEIGTVKDGICFITSTIIEWIPVFTTKPYFDIMVQSLTFCRKHQGLQLFCYVILDNHFHLVVGGPNLGRTITNMKMFTARQIIDHLQRDRKAWLLNQLAITKSATRRKVIIRAGFCPVANRTPYWATH